MDKDVDRILVKDRWGAVECAIQSNGRMPAKEALDKLKCEPQNLARLKTRFIRVAQLGPTKIGRDKLRLLQGEIYELKAHPYRVGCFFIENRCILTHIFDKKTGHAFVVKEIAKAKEIMEAHLRLEGVVRKKGGR
jgi:hypothetical protein